MLIVFIQITYYVTLIGWKMYKNWAIVFFKRFRTAGEYTYAWEGCPMNQTVQHWNFVGWMVQNVFFQSSFSLFQHT